MIKNLIGWFILVPISVVLILFAMANRHIVTVNFDPASSENPLLASIDVPLFIVFFVILLLGILLGSIAVWFSQRKFKSQRNKLRRTVKKLELELRETKKAARQNIENKSLLSPDDLI